MRFTAPNPPPQALDPASPILQSDRELHARIAEPVRAPCRIRHSAYLLPDEEEDTRAQVREGFEEVLHRLEIVQRAITWGERSGRVEVALPGGATLRIVWELHTQFYSYTTFHFPPDGEAAPPDDPARVPAFAFPHMPVLGTKLVDLDLVVLPGRELTDAMRAFIGPEPIYGGIVLAGEGRVWTTFRVNAQGQARYVVGAGELPPGRLGRLVRRVVEIENYCHMILLPLEEYREQVEALRRLEQRITQRSSDIAAELGRREPDPGAEHRWLVYLTRDLAELMQLSERMRHKLSAASSYYAIFEERLRWLREQTGDGFQSMEEFLTARIAPVHRNYRNFMERAEALTSQITVLGNMLRTRVNLSMEAQNLETMRSMKTRVELQLKLQRAVEGLSVVVITYYLTGLSNWGFKALEEFLPLPGGPILWSAGSVPVWFLLSFWVFHRVQAMLKREDHD